MSVIRLLRLILDIQLDLDPTSIQQKMYPWSLFGIAVLVHCVNIISEICESSLLWERMPDVIIIHVSTKLVSDLAPREFPRVMSITGYVHGEFTRQVFVLHTSLFFSRVWKSFLSMAICKSLHTTTCVTVRILTNQNGRAVSREPRALSPTCWQT